MRMYRTLIFSFVFYCFSFQVIAQTPTAATTLAPKISWPVAYKVEWMKSGADSLSVVSHQFGSLAKGDSVHQVFTLINTGNDTLFIYDVVPSCYCTVAYFTDSPILPQQAAQILTGFRIKEVGDIHHTLTIVSNTRGGSDFIELYAKGIPEQNAK